MNTFEQKVIVASAARTTSGNSNPESSQFLRDLDLVLDISAASGTTPTLDVSVEQSHDGVTWFSVTGQAFAQATAVSTQHKRVTVHAPLVRVKWTVGGTTPSFTFSVSGYGS